MILSNGACSSQPRDPSPVRCGHCVAKLAQKKLCAFRELLNNLDAADLTRKLGQNGCLVTEASANFENFLVRPGAKRSVMSAHVKGWEIVFSNPIGSGMS